MRYWIAVVTLALLAPAGWARDERRSVERRDRMPMQTIEPARAERFRPAPRVDFERPGPDARLNRPGPVSLPSRTSPIPDVPSRVTLPPTPADRFPVMRSSLPAAGPTSIDLPSARPIVIDRPFARPAVIDPREDRPAQPVTRIPSVPAGKTLTTAVDPQRFARFRSWCRPWTART